VDFALFFGWALPPIIHHPAKMTCGRDAHPASTSCYVSEGAMSIFNKKRLSLPVYGAIRGAGIASVTCVAIAAANLAYAGSGLVPKTAVSPAGGAPLASFDISWVDTVSGNYFLADRSNKAIDVVNTTSLASSQLGAGAFVGLKTTSCGNGCSGPNGVLTVNGQLVFAGDGGSTLRIFNIATGLNVQNIYTGFVASDPNRLDEGCFDTKDNIAVFANDNDGPGGGNGSNTSPQNGSVSGPYITFFTQNTTTGQWQIASQIIMDGGAGTQNINPNTGNTPVYHGPNATNGIEQCQYNPRDGKIWINLPEVNGTGADTAPGNTLVIDPLVATAAAGTFGINPQNNPIEAVYVDPLATCVGPQGMTIGPQPQILLGCNGNGNAGAANSTIILNDGTSGGVPGSVFAVLTGQVGSDEVDYDASSRVYTLAESKNFKTVTTPPTTPTLSPQLGIVNAISLVQDISIATGPSGSSAHSVANDPSSRKTFMPVPVNSASAKLCSTASGGAISDTSGCILVLTRQVSNTHDINGDTTSDVIWRDTSGNVGQWQMQAANCSNTQVANSGTAGIQNTNVFGQVPLTWQIVAQRDFVGNGSSSLLWRDNVGDVGVWLMTTVGNNGGTATCGLPVAGQIGSVTSFGTVPTTWSVAGTGEFNANGQGDILWEDPSGNLTVWLMNGATTTGTRSIGKVPAGYTVVGADRHGWIFFNNPTTNDVTIWVVKCPGNSSSCTVTSTDVGKAPAQWSIKGLGDLDGNGVTDIVWMDTGNDVGTWFLGDPGDVPTFVTSTVYGTVPSQWSIAQTGDMNGDGTADILWTDTSGNVGAWFMQGKAISAVASYGNVGTSWTVQSLNSQ
jgi:hypothetical protein